MVLHAAVTVDLGEDAGQNFGSLFEARGPDGRVVFGAGYLGAFNTDGRSDRHALHVYLRPTGVEVEDKVEQLPRVNSDGGVYLYAQNGSLYAKSRDGNDTDLRIWDEAAGAWRVDKTVDPLGEYVGDGLLTVDAQQITYRGQPVVTLEPTAGRIAESYVANGVIVYRRTEPGAEPFVNELIAQPWDPAEPESVDPSLAAVLQLKLSVEFLYGRGQRGDETLVTTNCGGVHVFDGKAWRSLNEPDIGPDGKVQTSFQVYTAVNHHDALLLGQYPTGELFRYAGDDLELLKGWPPVMPGVSTSAREAQSTAIYGGELYVGVWPWAEVWRYDRSEWRLAKRVFTHPEITAATTHPYEKETAALGEVLNRWGQRISGLVPFGDALFIATSAKGTSPYEPRFSFLDGDKWKEYGAVYRLRRPGNLTVATGWRESATRFEIIVSDASITVLQDGEQIGSTDLPDGFADGLALGAVEWGKGIYGPLRGRIVSSEMEPADR